MSPYSKDLVVLTADRNAEFALRGALTRPQPLGIRPVLADHFVHPHRDPGCLLEAHNFLRPFIRMYSRALVVMDREGCGRETVPRGELEAQIEEQLSQSGWGDRAAAIVIDPELEIWVWSPSPAVDSVLGWHGRAPALRTWLQEQEFTKEQGTKPMRPKEAMEEALRIVRKSRSSALYRQVAEQVSLARCHDPAFLKLKTMLQGWFPPPQAIKS